VSRAMVVVITMGVRQGFFEEDGATNPVEVGPEGPVRLTGVFDMRGPLIFGIPAWQSVVGPELRAAQRRL
jgi:hypothetical protein